MKNLRKIFLAVLVIVLFSFCNVSFADEIPLYSQAAILIDRTTGNVLYEVNSNAQMYPASTTKVLTAIIAIENCELDERVTASPHAINLIQSGYTNAKIQANEELSVEDLLYALLLKSANEAANVLAEHIGGSIENFANMMNEKAEQIGCENTHFVTANGIHDDNHYTTASDLAKITKYCMENKTFRDMVASKEYTLPATEQYPSPDRVLKNSNSLLKEGNKYFYPYAIGVKTGFTTQAKNCLIAASSKDGLELISVVLHAESTPDGRSARYLDTINLLEYGNNEYQSNTVLEKNEVIKTVKVKNATKDTKNLNIISNGTINVTTKKSENPDIPEPEVSINSDISAPISQGDILGKISYVVDNITYTTDLVAENDVNPISESTENNSDEEPETSEIDYKVFLYILLGLIIIRILIFIIKKNKGKH